MSTFDRRAKEWDNKDIRVQGAQVIAEAIKQKIKLTKEMEIIDFGVGTGLLGFEIARDVKHVFGVDTSKGMLEKLQEKNSQDLHITPIHQDIIKNPLTQTVDGLISSMTLHHIEDLEKFFKTIYKMLKKDGFIAIADLQSEDGTFHSDNTGVHHFGFDAKTLQSLVKKNGFNDIQIEKIHTIQKPHRSFDIFLLTARK